MSTSADQTLKVYDLRKGQIIYGHSGSSNVVNFNHNGTMFATGGTDSNVIVWTSNLIDLEQEQEVSKVKNAHKVSWRAMEGEADPKPKKSFGSKRYYDKKEKEEAKKEKENQS